MALTPDFVAFFKELAANNRTDWFDANRSRYKKHVKQPFDALVEELIAGVRERDPAVDVERKHCVFRINRDTRFSKDKTPYKLNVAAVIAPNGKKDMAYPGLYVHITPDMVWIGGGIYKTEKEVLGRIRNWMAHHPTEVHEALRDPAFVETFGGVQGERNKRLPKDLAEAAEQHDLDILYNKGFFYMAEHEGEDVVTRPDLVEFVLHHHNQAAAMNGLLKRAVHEA